MSTLDQRKKAFEDKFAYDAEKSFKIRVMASIELAGWAAEQMDFTDATKEEFYKEITDISIANKDNSKLIEFIKNILNENEIEFSAHYLEKLLQEKIEALKIQLN